MPLALYWPTDIDQWLVLIGIFANFIPSPTGGYRVCMLQ